MTFTADIPSRTFVVSSEVATMLLGNALIDMMRDKSFTADVPVDIVEDIVDARFRSVIDVVYHG